MAATRAARFASATCMTLVRASDVTVYAIGFLENQPSSVARRAAAAPDADGHGKRRRGLLPVDDEGDRRGLRQDRHRRSARSTRSATSRRTQPPTARWRKVEITRAPPGCQRRRASSRARATSRRTGQQAQSSWSGLSARGLRAYRRYGVDRFALSHSPIRPRSLTTIHRSATCRPSTIDSSSSATSRSAATRSAPCPSWSKG